MVSNVLDFFEAKVLPEYDIDVEYLYEGASQCTLRYVS